MHGFVFIGDQIQIMPCYYFYYFSGLFIYVCKELSNRTLCPLGIYCNAMAVRLSCPHITVIASTVMLWLSDFPVFT